MGTREGDACREFDELSDWGMAKGKKQEGESPSCRVETGRPKKEWKMPKKGTISALVLGYDSRRHYTAYLRVRYGVLPQWPQQK